MKKFLVVLAVAVSSFSFSQDDVKLDPILQSELDKALAEYKEWYKTTNAFKVGGNDMAVVGILEHIFFKLETKYLYKYINPDIAKLAINSFHPDDLFKTCTYDKWINSIPLLDSSQYHIQYKYIENVRGDNGKMYGTEYVIITNKDTGKTRKITIHYYDHSLRSIFDSDRSLFK
jgi:hypothetical protein